MVLYYHLQKNLNLDGLVFYGLLKSQNNLKTKK